jgi:hypothetical protein
MKNEDLISLEKNIIFSAVMEVMQRSKKDSEIDFTKIVKAIAASGSYWLSFLNIIYSRLKGIEKLLKEKNYDQIEKEIDLLIKAVSDTKKMI